MFKSHLYVILISTLWVLGTNTSNFYVTVQPHEEECYIEQVPQNSTGVRGVAFEVAEGGFLDIDFSIIAPDGHAVRRKRISSLRVVFNAHDVGKYTYCFSNKMSSLTPKVIMFGSGLTNEEEYGLSQGTKSDEKNMVDLSHQKLDDMIMELKRALHNVHTEEAFLRVRYKVNEEIKENTNKKLVLWSFIEAFILATMSLAQIYYLKTFFEKRRTV